MTYYGLYKDANRLLDKSKISLGEYEKMIEPLNDEIRKVGEWLDNKWLGKKCSVCSWELPYINFGQFKYCPNCGAKMERSE